MNLQARLKRLEHDQAGTDRVVMVCGADIDDVERQEEAKHESGQIKANDTILTIITGVQRTEH